ncbi:hypothetical protein BOTBODRAFT_28090 [Botryobasidium botryosum FD-172 SS1]|uniref:Uncharacterized protein n=1 Tax=Botryobasidium botryosum (strain FD-172 SS1) TaxID=930990 RepID=A0A067MV85_BOTB1|nr:hypothetical protein BOTBODRAFT_28090 [Botryobasidium botryosum FD-172 SS1]
MNTISRPASSNTLPPAAQQQQQQQPPSLSTTQSTTNSLTSSASSLGGGRMFPEYGLDLMEGLTDYSKEGFGGPLDPDFDYLCEYLNLAPS